MLKNNRDVCGLGPSLVNKSACVAYFRHVNIHVLRIATRTESYHPHLTNGCTLIGKASRTNVEISCFVVLGDLLKNEGLAERTFCLPHVGNFRARRRVFRSNFDHALVLQEVVEVVLALFDAGFMLRWVEFLTQPFHELTLCVGQRVLDDLVL